MINNKLMANRVQRPSTTSQHIKPAGFTTRFTGDCARIRRTVSNFTRRRQGFHRSRPSVLPAVQHGRIGFFFFFYIEISRTAFVRKQTQ